MKRILIVDDELVILDVLQRILESLGFEADIAEDEASALALYHPLRYDLVFIDVILKETCGFEIAGTLRADCPDQKIVMLTGLGPESVLESAATARIRVDGFLYKPFSMSQVQHIVNAVLDEASGPSTIGEGCPSVLTSGLVESL